MQTWTLELQKFFPEFKAFLPRLPRLSLRNEQTISQGMCFVRCLNVREDGLSTEASVLYHPGLG